MEEEMANLSLAQSSDASSVSAARSDSASSADVDNETRERFMRLVTKARQYAENGNIERALALNQKALSLRYSDKLKRRIEKMKKFLAEQALEEEEEGESNLKSLGQGFMLHRKIHGKLYSHQKEGVLWFWSLHAKGKGGILADDMGLGKTIQVIAFLAGMFDMEKIKSVLIVVPLSVLPNWANEFAAWTPGINITQFHGSSLKQCERGLARVRSRGGVVLTTYGLIVTRDIFTTLTWDYVILDEGHRIKNPTKTSKSMHRVPAKNRIILTGTPVQNNLKELWALFDYVHQGSLLGTMRTFKMEFESPIIRARERDASGVEKRLGQEMAEALKSIIQPYFLRRTKAQVAQENEQEGGGDSLKMPSMTRKNDLVIWLHLTDTQQQIYNDFISLDHVKELLMTKKSPLVALTVLKKICDHPRLLSKRACLQLGLDGDSYDEEALEQPSAYESAANQIDMIPDEVLVGESGKMQVLVDLVDRLREEGHRTLIFSQSRKLLDIISKVVKNRGHKVARLDGKVTQMSDRDAIVKKFQNDPSYTIFLLTVQVGGVGLTITAADRVIIYDPNWNPATDAQAVDRAFRIGQEKNVVVYRLITCGTVEEKIYRRQVFKDSITQQTTGASANPYRYFTKMELKELFSLDDPTFSKTQQQLQEMHGSQRQSDTQLDEHIAFLHSLNIFGISDHDLMFKQTTVRDDEEDDDVQEMNNIEENNAQFINYRKQKAQQLIAEESNIPISYEERSKGVMRYPPTAGRVPPPSNAGVPAPSGLFTTVGTSSNNVVQVSDDDGGGDDDDDVIDITEAMELDSDSPTNQGTERRVLQPLSAEEVRYRSPQVPTKGHIVKEEILISPDGRSPLVGLEKSLLRKKMLEEASSSNASSPVKAKLAELNSPTSSPGKNKFAMFSPIKKQSPSRSGRLTPKLLPVSSKNTLTSTPNLPPSLKVIASSPDYDSKLSSSLKMGHRGAGFGAESGEMMSSTPHTEEVLVPETPDSAPVAQRSSVTSPSQRSLQEDPMDVSSACRKLSFIAMDTTSNSPVSGLPAVGEDKTVYSPQAKKHKILSNPSSSNNSPLKLSESETGLKDLLKGSPRVQSDNDIRDLSSASRALFKGSESPNKSKSKKRRSVCVSRLNISDSDEEKDSNEREISDEENKENDNCGDQDDEEEEEEDVNKEEDEGKDKENCPEVRSVGGRNIIISDSESDGGSCFEVEDSTDDEAGGQSLAEEEESDNDEEEVAEDPEDNEEFQNLILIAKQLYKQKSYSQSLEYQEKALAMFALPELQAMADKTRLRAAQQKLEEEQMD
ncbi:DNA excision repair protein ERCC-6-like [Aplysia californica]|uniref:DNA excision repair protein ERCC-6-like n=1 Tax=Aplysia californica TaxID=6500 RepID=A0ABM0ZWN0_APLCA|nr:DNA excision repair protein ERCC-6-like [Aplysia californica]